MPMCCTGWIATWAILLAACASLPAQEITAEHDPLRSSVINDSAGSAGLFVENRGQFAPNVRYKLTTLSGAVWLTDAGVVFDGAALEARAPGSAVLSETFAGANSNVAAEPGSAAAYSPVSAGSFSSVDYKDVWPGISVRLVAHDIGIEQQFIVQPGANTANIAVSYQGAGSMTVDDRESPVIDAAAGTLRQIKLNIYQEQKGRRITVHGRYRLTGLATYGFQVNTYTREFPLVISSTMQYSPEFSEASTGLPVIDYFYMAPASTLPGQAAIGTLSVSGATSATINGIEANCSNGECGGTFFFYPTSTTTYVLQASGAAGNTTAAEQVEVGEYQPNPAPVPAGLKVAWQGACWIADYPKSVCDGFCQGMAFSVNIPAPPSELPLEATLYLNTTTCNPAEQDNLNDTGTVVGSGGWIFWFDHHPNRKNTSAIWTIGNQSSGCVSYASVPECQ